MTPARPHRAIPPRSQRGAALLAIILLAVLGLVAFLLAGLQDEHRVQRREQVSQVRLAEARDALVSFAVQQWCQAPAASASPQAQLPCPASSATGVPGSGCASALRIGRLPWPALATGPIRDDAMECLWYVREPDLATLPTAPPWPIVARIISPGTPLAGQVRPNPTPDVAPCGTNLAPANFISTSSFTPPPPGGRVEAGQPTNDDVLELDFGQFQTAMAQCPTACSNAAAVLLSNIPPTGNSNGCRNPPGSSPTAACQAAADALAAGPCPACTAAGAAFIAPPCITDLSSCQAQIATLRACR